MWLSTQISQFRSARNTKYVRGDITNYYYPFLIFQNNSFFLNFLICASTRNLDPLTQSNLMWDTLYNLYAIVGYTLYNLYAIVGYTLYNLYSIVGYTLYNLYSIVGDTLYNLYSIVGDTLYNLYSIVGLLFLRPV